jgi:hypothetical protein
MLKYVPPNNTHFSTFNYGVPCRGRERGERERERKKEKKKEEWAVFLRIVQNIKKAE